MNPSSFVMLATAALFVTDAPIVTGSPRERRYRPGSTPPKPPEPTPEPAPLPPPDPVAQMKALAIPPVTTRAQRRERAWLARVREGDRFAEDLANDKGGATVLPFDADWRMLYPDGEGES